MKRVSCTVLVSMAIGWLAMAETAHAQKTTLGDVVLAEKPERQWWTNQLRAARVLGAKTLKGLQASSIDDATSMDESVLQCARDTYALIRSARAGIGMATGSQKPPDPLLDLVFKRVDEAWNLARFPAERIDWAYSRQEYLAGSISKLTRSLQLIDEVLILVP